MSTRRRAVAVYWPADSLQQARAAHTTQLRRDGASAQSLVAWVADAIRVHAGRPPAERAVAPAIADGSGGVRRQMVVDVDLLQVVDAAIADDLQHGGLAASRSAWIGQAVHAAVQRLVDDVGDLDEPPAQLRRGRRPAPVD